MAGTEKRTVDRVTLPGPSASEPEEIRVKVVDIAVPFGSVLQVVLNVVAALLLIAIPLYFLASLLFAFGRR
jgi:hypothetical protein